ncbi:MAG: hypothetical protein ACYTGX_17915, partial [Planctomycetota bacterium]
HYYRLGDGSPPVDLELFMTEQPRDLGELVSVTSGLLPDIEDGTYSTTSRLCEIESRSFNPAEGKVKATVGVTSYRRGNYRLIHPTGAVDYDSQTQNVKDTYASASDASDQLGTANDPTHEIGT